MDVLLKRAKSIVVDSCRHEDSPRREITKVRGSTKSSHQLPTEPVSVAKIYASAAQRGALNCCTFCSRIPPDDAAFMWQDLKLLGLSELGELEKCLQAALGLVSAERERAVYRLLQEGGDGVSGGSGGGVIGHDDSSPSLANRS